MTMGEWVCESATLWAYRVGGRKGFYGYLVKGSETGGRADVWTAVVGRRYKRDDTTIAEGVSFEEAQAAVERYAADSDRKPWSGGDQVP